MDKFEDAFNRITRMSAEGRNKSIKDMEMDCICPLCPNYNDCAKNAEELLFCVVGKSKCIENEKSCICLTCPFARKYEIGIEYNFYCTRGSEIEQRGK